MLGLSGNLINQTIVNDNRKYTVIGVVKDLGGTEAIANGSECMALFEIFIRSYSGFKIAACLPTGIRVQVHYLFSSISHLLKAGPLWQLFSEINSCTGINSIEYCNASATCRYCCWN